MMASMCTSLSPPVVRRRQIGEHGGRGVPQRAAFLRKQTLGDRHDVIADVAIGRKRETLAANLQIAQPGADVNMSIWRPASLM